MVLAVPGDKEQPVAQARRRSAVLVMVSRVASFRCLSNVIGSIALAVSIAIPIVAGGCTVIDSTLPERGFAMNVGSSTLREDVILLNIVRASRHEPMNFVALSKYTGLGTLEAGLEGTRNIGLIYDILNKGPLAIGTSATSAAVQQTVRPNLRGTQSANFDLAPLDNREFYAGFLAQLELTTINLLVNAGLSRELVLHSIVGAARVTHVDGTVHQFKNDPANDGWLGTYGREAAAHCESLADSGALHPPFVHEVWNAPHSHDCSYQKFLYFLHAAVQYGMTTETREERKSGASTPADGTRGKDMTGSSRRVVLCYDPAIAREYGKTVSPLGACGSKQLTLGPRNYKDLGPYVRLINPVLRSSYAVYQFYGRLLGGDHADRVRLIDAGTPRLPTGDRRILTVRSEGTDCFARAYHRSGAYCVPNEGANNTKEIFFLLNALVYLSTTRSALPATPTVQLAP